MLYIPPMAFRVCIVHHFSRRIHNDEVHTQICKILQETGRKQPGDDRPRLEPIRLKFRNANKPDGLLEDSEISVNLICCSVKSG